MADAQDLINQGINKGKEEKEVEADIGLHEIGLANDKISLALKISMERVVEIRGKQGSK